MHKKIIGNPTTTPMAIPDFLQENPNKADYIKNRDKIATKEFVTNAINSAIGEALEGDY